MVSLRGLARFFGRLIGRQVSRYRATIIDSHPHEHDIQPGVVYVLRFGDYDKWAYLRCPCPRNDVIRLNLSPAHRPRWTIRIKRDIPDISPSIWQHDGCFSHFFVRDGKVIWAADSGRPPHSDNVGANGAALSGGSGTPVNDVDRPMRRAGHSYSPHALSESAGPSRGLSR